MAFQMVVEVAALQALLVCLVGLGESMARCGRSSSSVHQGGVVCTGMYFLRTCDCGCSSRQSHQHG